MLPVALLAVGVVMVVLVVSIFVYRLRASVHVGCESEEEDDDDEELAMTSAGVRITAETAALMDGEDESSRDPKPTRRRSVQADELSLFAYLLAFLRPVEKSQQKKTKAPLMHRRTKGVKKIHKPYFYPLLDETAQWYAEWETRKQHAADSHPKPATEAADVRIDKPSPPEPPSRDLLDSLDCVSLVSFRSSSHTIIPVAAI